VTSSSSSFFYSEKWTGTSLPWLSVEESVALAENDGTDRWTMGRWPDPILRMSADPVPAHLFGTDTLKKACDLLRNTAVAAKAVGLAAEQCGVNARIVYLELPRGALTMVNPRVVNRSPETDMRVWRECCLVLPPTFVATVLRDNWIDIEYQCIEKGQWHAKRLAGETARAAQHELDHDRGILVTDHVSLDEMENDVMRSIEQSGHDQRMLLAYNRYTSEPYG
jgi:peptide deformylase